MSEVISPATGRRYGIKKVCQVLSFPRSSFYSRLALKAGRTKKPGPRSKWSDEDLLKFIKRDLDRTPFQGEGHRKVWARLRFLDGIRVSRTRVLGVMRENNLLSPHRIPRPANENEGEIITPEPNLMWGADGSRVMTVEDGWSWIFAAVEHWNAECLGCHVSKGGTRFEALEPVSMGVQAIFGGLGPDVARGLRLRFDHGTQYLSDHFQNQIRYWGITPSPSFVSQPQTNGVVERFFRTLKEQVIHGRIFRNVEELRQAVSEFVEVYNHSWRLEKLGYMTPIEFRKTYLTRKAA